METVFEHWLQLPSDFEGDAITGLKNLNTTESRAALATIASTPDKPNNRTQVPAIASLAEMGDPQYYPLMVQLLASPDQEVRREAIFGMGSLGGDAAVPESLRKCSTLATRWNKMTRSARSAAQNRATR